VARLLPRPPDLPALRLAAVVLLAIALPVAAISYYFSPEYTDVGYRPLQPVAYSHALHAGELGIDCLYCHATVDRAPAAVVPPTKVCMSCHHVVRRDSPALAVVRASLASARPVAWVRVHDLPGHVHFDHRPHLRAGVGCATCHGRVDQMDVVEQAKPLSMAWCLDCHHDPEPHLRPEDELTNMDWTPSREQRQLGARIRAEKNLRPPLDCTGCHR
jgi:hypothetical protein